ncbi:MAG: DUF4394 domain-containing protein [Leptolyngbyaceae cyanobacterium CRU_2_3]|nr:DUF4394 domain-containing protein [Leptolyngbyaceae cyanobacterium CRU_2_3]
MSLLEMLIEPQVSTSVYEYLRGFIMSKVGHSFSDAVNVGQLSSSRKVFRSSLDQSDKFSYYKLKLSARSALTGVLNGLSENADLAFFDFNQKRIGVSNNSGKQKESLFKVLDEGTYFVRVQRKSGAPKYRLALSIAAPPDEAGNTTPNARPAAIGSAPAIFQDAVGAADSDDFYRIDNTVFSNLSLNLTGLSADANVQILNSAGTVIRSSTASGTTSESINAGLAAGTFFVRVFPGAGGGTTNYDLSLALDPLKFVGLTDDNKLVSFSSGGSTSAAGIAVTGLQANEKLVGIDFRPATGELFGVGDSSRLYALNATTGAATAIGTLPLATALSGNNFGVDFNPVPDRLRVVSDTAQNLRLNPITGGIAGVDPNLSASGIVASAYTNNRAGANVTTLYSINATTDQLVIQGGINGTGAAANNPNNGILNPVGALGVNFGSNVGFDIFTDGTGIENGFAVSGSTLYNINLITGAATVAGTVASGSTPLNLVGLALTA